MLENTIQKLITSMSVTLKWLGRRCVMTKRGLALKSVGQGLSQKFWASERQLFVQTLSLPVNSLSSARKSVEIMLDRLSPVPAEEIVWDLIGPLENKGKKHVFRLGILRARDLGQFRSDDQTTAHLMASTGEVYQFINDAGLRRIGKNTVRWLLLILTCYAAILWSLAQWSWNLGRAANVFNQQSAVHSRALGQSKLDAAAIEFELALIASFENKSETSRHIREIAAISESLGDKDWLTSMEISPQKIQLIGYAQEPADIVGKISKALPDAKIRLGSINADSVSGLNRFSMTVIKPFVPMVSESSL